MTSGLLSLSPVQNPLVHDFSSQMPSFRPVRSRSLILANRRTAANHKRTQQNEIRVGADSTYTNHWCGGSLFYTGSGSGLPIGRFPAEQPSPSLLPCLPQREKRSKPGWGLLLDLFFLQVCALMVVQPKIPSTWEPNLAVHGGNLAGHQNKVVS